MEAVRKVERLKLYGARLLIVASELHHLLGEAVGRGEAEWDPGPLMIRHVAHAACVIVCEPTSTEGRRALEVAGQAGVLVNAADAAHLSDFIAMAGFQRGPLEVAVHTSGASAALSRRLREHLSQLVTEEHGRLADILGGWRPTVRTALKSPDARRAFWLTVVDDALLTRMETGSVGVEDVDQAIRLSLGEEER
jgi:siroheme synthase-like protein